MSETDVAEQNTWCRVSKESIWRGNTFWNQKEHGEGRSHKLCFIVCAARPGPWPTNCGSCHTPHIPPIATRHPINGLRPNYRLTMPVLVEYSVLTPQHSGVCWGRPSDRGWGRPSAAGRPFTTPAGEYGNKEWRAVCWMKIFGYVQFEFELFASTCFVPAKPLLVLLLYACLVLSLISVLPEAEPGWEEALLPDGVTPLFFFNSRNL